MFDVWGTVNVVLTEATSGHLNYCQQLTSVKRKTVQFHQIFFLGFDRSGCIDVIETLFVLISSFKVEFTGNF